MEDFMNKEQMQGKAEQLKGKFKEAFAKLTDNDLMLYESKRDKFVGKVVELQGITKEAAEKRIKSIEDSCCNTSKVA
jgi:uncharacterized protein YjbJ (UPF0337 family)